MLMILCLSNLLLKGNLWLKLHVMGSGFHGRPSTDGIKEREHKGIVRHSEIHEVRRYLYEYVDMLMNVYSFSKTYTDLDIIHIWYPQDLPFYILLVFTVNSAYSGTPFLLQEF